MLLLSCTLLQSLFTQRILLWWTPSWSRSQRTWIGSSQPQFNYRRRNWRSSSRRRSNGNWKTKVIWSYSSKYPLRSSKDETCCWSFRLWRHRWRRTCLTDKPFPEKPSTDVLQGKAETLRDFTSAEWTSWDSVGAIGTAWVSIWTQKGSPSAYHETSADWTLQFIQQHLE